MPRRQKSVPTAKAVAGLSSGSLRRSRSAARQRSYTLVVSAAAEPGESNPEVTAASSSSSSSGYTVPGEVSSPIRIRARALSSRDGKMTRPPDGTRSKQARWKS
jgi:hypothetical protein